MKKRGQGRELWVFLPDKEHLEVTVGLKSRGQEVLNSVSELLGVVELHLFGLSIVKDNEYLFLDLDLKLGKYFGKEWKKRALEVPFILFLRVQFYVESGLLISNRRVQQLYYADLRQKVLHSRSYHQEALFFQLAASALQADLGDVEQIKRREEEEERGERKNEEEGKYKPYFLPEHYFPSWVIKRRGRDFLHLHTPTLHRELKAMTRHQASLLFIKQAGGLQDGPITFYHMKQDKKQTRCSVLIGVALRGFCVYQEVEGMLSLLYELSWTDIDRLTFQGKRFEIHAIGSLCIPKLVYYTPSAFHSKHLLRHLSDSHRLHINTRDTVHFLQQLEDRRASHLFREAYIYDREDLKKMLRSTRDGGSVTSSVSDYSVFKEKAWPEDEGEETVIGPPEVELCVDEPEEVPVDDPSKIPWLAELLGAVSVDGALEIQPSCWADVAMEMKEVLKIRGLKEMAVD